ncbi:MAG: peptide deformylase, partial [Rhodospirillales bacterium]|nr:peptide deformylase [Rhodospirillales bacterium]
LINPEIEILTKDQLLGWEGCLSVPGLTGAVLRFTHIRYRGLTPTGETITREATDFHARVVQHECDHLDGMLYPMRMTDMSQFGFAEEINRNRELLNSIREGDGEEEFEEDGEE